MVLQRRYDSSWIIVIETSTLKLRRLRWNDQNDMRGEIMGSGGGRNDLTFVRGGGVVEEGGNTTLLYL